MIKNFLAYYAKNITFSIILFAFYALADLSLTAGFALIANGNLSDFNNQINNFFKIENSYLFNYFLIIIFIIFRYFLLKYSSYFGYKEIYNIYKDLGIRSITRIINNKKIPQEFTKPGYMFKFLSTDIDFIVGGFLIPLTTLFIEIIIITIISIILIIKFGILHSTLILLTAYLLFIIILKRQSKVNDLLGKLRENSQEKKSKVISLIQNSLFDIYSYRPSKYIINKFSDVHQLTRINSESQIRQQILGRANFETSFSILICLSIIIIIFFNDQNVYAKNKDNLVLILAFSIRVMPSIGRIIQSSQSISYSWPCFKQFFLSNKNKSIIYLKKNNLIYPKTKDIILKIKKDQFFIENNKLFDIEEFNLNNGFWITIFGKSGSGKSSFLEYIYNISTSKIKNLNIAFLPHKSSLISNNIYENIALSKNYDSNRINNILKDMNLDELIIRQKSLNISKKDATLDISGGQLQRLMIARALYHNKEILILDEFTSALDKENEIAILKLLKEKQIKKKLTIICSSHKDIFKNFSDSIYQIKDYTLIYSKNV